MAAKDNGPVPPGAPSGAPSPGVTICQGCVDFANCEKWVAQGLIPACAGPNANGNAGLSKPGSTTTASPSSAASGPSVVDNATSAITSFIPAGFFGTLGQQIGLMLLALSLTAVGFYILFSDQINGAVKKVV